MPINRWTRKQKLAVLHLRLRHEGRLTPTNPDIARLAEAMNRTESAIVMRNGNFDAVDPSYPGVGLWSASRLTRDTWAEYERDPERIRAEARAAFEYLLGGMGSSAESDQGNATTPLHDAARNGHTEMTQTLVLAGADIHALDEDGITPLHAAVSMGHVETAQFLISVGANVNPGDVSEYTPLHIAAADGNTDEALALISAGADPNSVAGEDGRTPLDMAAENGHAEMVQALALAGADLNSRVDGDSPLHTAAWQGHTETARALIAAGADVSAKDKYGATPLHVSYAMGHIEIGSALISAGANPNAIDNLGNTPFDYADWP